MAIRPEFVSAADRQRHKMEDAHRFNYSQDALAKSSKVRNISWKDAPKNSSAGRKRSRDEASLPQFQESNEDFELRRAQTAELRDQFLGSGAAPKKKIHKPSDHRKFKFDWDSIEDTSTNAPLCSGERPLFGRGFIAGVDRPEKSSRRGICEKSSSSMSHRDWHIFNENHGISVRFSSKTKDASPRTMRRWDESGVHEHLLRSIAAAGFSSPTPIQMAAIPFGLQGFNMVGIAGTGTGKTVAFLVPILEKLLRRDREMVHDIQGPEALVLAPTRDLALQIESEARRLAGDRILISIAVGGRSIDSQSRDAASCDLMIATPGRLLDLMEQRYTSLDRVDVLVVDEADRMMEEMAEDLEAALEAAQGRRQTFMFSATMPPPVERLARHHMTPGGAATVTVTAAAVSNAVNAASISQQFVFLRGGSSEKPAKLRDVARASGAAIVFVNEKASVNDIRNILRNAGHAATGIYGEMRQVDREKSLDDFRSGRYRFLVATDLASRGIDVPGVSYVINYDTPRKLDTYLHRIGRTGRAGKRGTAITFLTPGDREMFPKFRKHLEDSKLKVPHELMERQH